MFKFLDGPADGQQMELARTPVLLRVVRKPDGTWDGLDQLGDEPELDEDVFVYEIEGQPGTGYLDYTDKATGRRRGRPFVHATYRYCVVQPPKNGVSGQDWATWCESVRASVMERHR